MAHPNLALIQALRQASVNLRNNMPYAWGHHGACNCGHILQVVTHLSKEEILEYAQTGIGEWTEIASGWCETTSLPVDILISRLEAMGLTATDIHNLEYLQDRKILEKLPGGMRWLQKNKRADVVLYFETMANVLEEMLICSIQIPKLDHSTLQLENT
jgi:hypothetical protein